MASPDGLDLGKKLTMDIKIYLLKVSDDHKHILTSFNNLATPYDPDLLEAYQQVFRKQQGNVLIEPFYSTSGADPYAVANAFAIDEKATVYLKASAISFWVTKELKIRNIVFNAMEMIPSSTQCPSENSDPSCSSSSHFVCQDNGESPPTSITGKS